MAVKPLGGKQPGKVVTNLDWRRFRRKAQLLNETQRVLLRALNSTVQNQQSDGGVTVSRGFRRLPRRDESFELVAAPIKTDAALSIRW
jgi:hypothetical protein